MSQIKIETITDVHIGSGNDLMLNNEIFETKEEGGTPVYAVMDPRKVYGLIGQQGINQWVVSIERGKPLSEVMRTYAPAAKPRDYSKRLIAKHFNGSFPNPAALKEQIHDGKGRPYIPGSSIKGAIRTAVLATLARPQANSLNIGQGKITGKFAEERFFGKDANQDVFRFLQVGDATFNYKDRTEALRMVNLNERKNSNYWDRSKASVIETIQPELSAELHLKVDMLRYSRANNEVHTMPQEMASVKALFKCINAHTQYLLETERSHWGNREPDDDSDKTTEYIDEIKKLKKIANECAETNGQSCLLRVGSGSGWRFMTGAWSEKRPDFNRTIVWKARPRNQKYQDYCFPKTRRLSDHLDLLGFVKLTIIESDDSTKKQSV